jgi:hypothetical protein
LTHVNVKGKVITVMEEGACPRLDSDTAVVADRGGGNIQMFSGVKLNPLDLIGLEG